MKSLNVPLLQLLLAFTLLFNSLPAAVMGADNPYLVKSFTVSSGSDIRVNTSGGSIALDGTNGNKATVKVFIRKNGRIIDNQREIDEALENLTIDVKQQGNSIIATAEKESSFWEWDSYSVSFEVITPREINSDLKTSGGKIKVSGVTGMQQVKTSGGSLVFHQVDGELNGKTSGGSIKVNSFNGIMNIKTSGGSISINNARGDMQAYTSGGSIKVDNIEGSLVAKTSGGSIRANILNLNDRLELSTSGGSISANLPAGIGMELNLKGNRVRTSLNNFNGESDDDYVRGSTNGGGIPVTMRTSGGTVTLNFIGQASK
jgi:hypothetical protein